MSALSRLLLAAFLIAAAATWVAPQPTLYALATGQSGVLYEIAAYAAAPRAVPIGVTGVTMGDIAAHPATGKLYGIDWTDPSVLYEIDPLTARVTVNRYMRLVKRTFK